MAIAVKERNITQEEAVVEIPYTDPLTFDEQVIAVKDRVEQVEALLSQTQTFIEAKRKPKISWSKGLTFRQGENTYLTSSVRNSGETSITLDKVRPSNPRIWRGIMLRVLRSPSGSINRVLIQYSRVGSGQPEIFTNTPKAIAEVDKFLRGFQNPTRRERR